MNHCELIIVGSQGNWVKFGWKITKLGPSPVGEDDLDGSRNLVTSCVRSIAWLGLDMRNRSRKSAVAFALCLPNERSSFAGLAAGTGRILQASHGRQK